MSEEIIYTKLFSSDEEIDQRLSSSDVTGEFAAQSSGCDRKRLIANGNEPRQPK
jgi:hypothetical protein